MGKHVMINNLSYAGIGQQIATGSTETTNSWNLGLTFTDEMFESLNVTDYKVERDDDYRLTNPQIQSLFKLKSNNPAIDKGTVHTFIRLKPYFAIPYSGAKPDLGAKEFDSGEWTFPTPDETEPIDTTSTGTGNRPVGTKQIIVNVASQFTINSGAKSTVWGPFCLASAESTVFDFQPVGSSSGAAIIEFSKDNSTWVQVGAQVKNGSTSWVTGKLIDLSADTAPWGPTIYIRFNNISTKNVNIKNLVITGTLYTVSDVKEVKISAGRIVSELYYNLNGWKVEKTTVGLLIKKTVYENGRSCVEKILKIK
jgi:hypothetical protein